MQPSLRHRRDPAQTMRAGVRGARLVLAATLLLVIGLQSGCATRWARSKFVDRTGLSVDFMTEKEGYFKTVEKNYEHPARIAPSRMAHVLNAIEVETREKKGPGATRQPAIHPLILEELAEALSSAFAEVGPGQEISVSAIRKEAELGIFHKKFLTSFLAYMKDGQLYIAFSRVDWPIPQAKETKRLPEPVRDQGAMPFRVVSGPHLYYAGPQSLEIDWQNAVFRGTYRLPGSTGGERKRREVLMQAPVPREELDRENPGAVGLDELTPDQLRALADLEEDRRAGRITETTYQRSRRQLLRPR